MTLLALFPEIVAGWRAVFPQQRTFQRALRQAFGSLVCLGRRCLTRIIWTWRGQDRSWSGEHFLDSRCQRQPQDLFAPLAAPRSGPLPRPAGRPGPGGTPPGVAVDDTCLPKTGRCIPQAFYRRNPLSPPSM